MGYGKHPARLDGGRSDMGRRWSPLLAAVGPAGVAQGGDQPAAVHFDQAGAVRSAVVDLPVAHEVVPRPDIGDVDSTVL